MKRRKMTTELFIQRARAIYGNRYDYEKTNLEHRTSEGKVIVTCRKHGDFLVDPYQHIRKDASKRVGCPRCTTSHREHFTKESFLRRAHEIWGDRYDYTKTDLTHRNSKGEVIVTCRVHGDFWVKPGEHVRPGGKATGCKYCSGHYPYTNERVRRTAEEIFGTERFDFSSIDVKKTDGKKQVTVICNVHGPFKITINNLLKKGRKNCCPYCSKTNHPYTTKSYIAKAKRVHHGRYEYPNLVFTGINNKVKIECPIHGKFEQVASYHILGSGCPKCNPTNKSNSAEFVEKARKVHGDRYDYSKVEYVNSTTPVEITCPEHNSFWQRPNNHLSGANCPQCHKRQMEEKVLAKLREEDIEFVREKSFEGLQDKKPLRFDFYIPAANAVIEVQGIQHFEPVEFFGGKDAHTLRCKHDEIKREFCRKNGIRLLYYADKPQDNYDLFTNLDELVAEIRK